MILNRIYRQSSVKQPHNKITTKQPSFFLSQSQPKILMREHLREGRQFCSGNGHEQTDLTSL